MKIGLGKIYWKVLLIIQCLFIFSTFGITHKLFIKKETQMSPIYPKLYANSLRNNFTTIETKALGKECWRILRNKSEISSPSYLLASIVAIYSISTNQISAINTENGNIIWSCKKWPNSPVVLYNDLIYYQSIKEEDKLEAVNILTGKKSEKIINLHFVNEKQKLIFFEPQKSYFIAACFSPSTEILNEKGIVEKISPDFVLYAESYENKGFKWMYSENNDKSSNYSEPNNNQGIIWIVEDENSILYHIIVPNKNQIFLGTETELLLYDANSASYEAKAIRSFKYPLKRVFNLCADDLGNLYFIGSNGKDNIDVLLMCNDKGNIIWKWEKPDIANTQFSIMAITAKGEIVVADSSTVYCVAKGSPVWQYSTGHYTPKYITTTADGSILIAAENMLFLCKDGKKIFSFDAGTTIVAPPVVDAQGCIYLLTMTYIIKLK